MSTNRKNREGPVLRNLVKSQAIPKRCIISTEVKIESYELRKIVDDVNEYIGQINRLVFDRNVPYIRLDEAPEYHSIDKARILLRSETTDTQILSEIHNEYNEDSNNTFLIELYINNNGYIEIGCSSDNNLNSLDLSSFILCDREYLPCVLIDVFLDSALFNSYSFLKALQPSQKREFNKIKVHFLKEYFSDFTSLDPMFYTFNNKNYNYLSLAFFVRTSQDDIDIPKLIDLWDDFINKYYSNKVHEELPVIDQLKTVVDLDQYSADIRCEIQKKPKGTYWILRIHREPQSKLDRQSLKAIFGKADIEAEKIINFEELEPIYEMVREHKMTAFKIIVP